jgi:hypothetical protein
MPYSVRCKACSSSFAIPDDIWDKRVRGRVATLKCRSCKAEIQVDGNKPSLSQSPSSAPTSSPNVASAGSGVSTDTASSSQTSRAMTRGGPVATRATGAATSVGSPGSRVPVLGVKPVAKAADDVAAADLGWSMVPPAAELLSVGVTSGSGTATDPQQPRPGAPAATSVGATGQHPEVPHEPAKTSGQTSSVTATKTTRSVAATTQTKQTEVSIKTPVQPRQRTSKTNSPSLESNVITSATATPIASEAPSTTPALKLEAREKPAAAPTAAPVATATESEPSIADLWVVSYGDDDDREMTEKQIATELVRGNINLSTIVWHDGMPEWMPISGVSALAKHAPTPKPTARIAKQSSPRSQPRSAVPQPTSSVAGKPATGTSAASTTPRPAATPTSREPKSPLNVRREAKSSPTIAEPLAPATTQSRKPTPPPLPKSGVSHEHPLRVEGSIDASDDADRETAASQVEPTAGTSGTRPPALPRRRPSPASSPWDEPEAEPVEDVLTSAPDVGTIQSEPRTHGSAASSDLAQASPRPAPVALAPAETSRAGAAFAPVASPGKVSFPPPKPAQTATSTVMRTEASSTAADKTISDEEFLAMQRRLPKWAIPVGIVVAVAAIGGVVYLLQSKEELPPLPVAPVVVPIPVASSRDTADAPVSRRGPAGTAVPPASSSNQPSDEKDFARLFAESVGKATGGFDPKAAEAAAASAIDAASRCRHAPEPPGRAQVVVTFATSGQVLSVQVAPPHTKTATGACVTAALQPVKITPFQGRPGRLTLNVPLR